MAVQLPSGKNQFFDASGNMLAGGRLYTYVPGTSTPKAAYTTSAGTTAHTNPIVLDSRGEAAIYWTGSYDVVLRTAADAVIWGPERLEEAALASVATDLANFEAELLSTTSTAEGDALIGVKRTATNAAGTTLHSWIERQPVSPLDFGAVGDGTTDDTTAVSRAASAARPIHLPKGYNFVVNSPVTISNDIIGEGCDDGQSTITLTGTGSLVVGDEHCRWENFAIKSAVNNLTFVDCQFSYFTFHKFRIENLSSATGQKGVEFDTTSRSVYFADLDDFKIRLDYPIFVTGNSTQVFNANKIGGSTRCYFQSFATAITQENTTAWDANQVVGYFETGTNLISFNNGAMRQNRFRLVQDGVTRTLNITPTVTDVNLWEILDGGFVVNGTYPQNQVLIGTSQTNVRATTATAQSINNATATILTWDTEVFDSLSEFSNGTGVFTAKNAGKYRITARSLSASVAWDAGERWEIRVYKNGSLYATGDYNPADAALTIARMASVTALVDMNGTTDTLDVRVIHNQGASVNTSTDATANFIEIERVS
jgi:hypothetical protein